MFFILVYIYIAGSKILIMVVEVGRLIRNIRFEGVVYLDMLIEVFGVRIMVFRIVENG